MWIKMTRGAGRSDPRNRGQTATKDARRSIQRSKAEFVLQLRSELPGIGKVRPSKGVAVVEHVMVVAEVERAEAQVPFLSERFADRAIHRRVGGQVSGAIAIEKSGTVVHAYGGPTLPGKLEVRS